LAEGPGAAKISSSEPVDPDRNLRLCAGVYQLRQPMIEDIFPGSADVMANFDRLFIVTYKSQHGKMISRNWNSPAESDRIALDSLLAESSNKPPIVVGSDHAGFRATGTIKKCLDGAGYRVEDVGMHSEESVGIGYANTNHDYRHENFTAYEPPAPGSRS
jgi:hypothetical protein